MKYTSKELSGRAKVPLAKHFDDLMSKFGGWVEPKKLHTDISYKINNPGTKMDGKIESIVKAMDESLQTAPTPSAPTPAASAPTTRTPATLTAEELKARALEKREKLY